MKSSVFGAIPSAEFTPVFSPTDCAEDGEARLQAGQTQGLFFSRRFPLEGEMSRSTFVQDQSSWTLRAAPRARPRSERRETGAACPGNEHAGCTDTHRQCQGKPCRSYLFSCAKSGAPSVCTFGPRCARISIIMVDVRAPYRESRQLDTETGRRFTAVTLGEPLDVDGTKEAGRRRGPHTSEPRPAIMPCEAGARMRATGRSRKGAAERRTQDAVQDAPVVNTGNATWSVRQKRPDRGPFAWFEAPVCALGSRPSRCLQLAGSGPEVDLRATNCRLLVLRYRSSTED
ncbi:hypothetical protein ABIB95_003023 [Bradyrhizobium sp. LA2.1]